MLCLGIVVWSDCFLDNFKFITLVFVGGFVFCFVVWVVGVCFWIY